MILVDFGSNPQLREERVSVVMHHEIKMKSLLVDYKDYLRENQAMLVSRCQDMNAKFNQVEALAGVDLFSD
jgi:hypothetical protein